MEKPIERGYVVILSSGPNIPFDPEELDKILKAIKDGDVARLKRGIFNPSFFVSVVEDVERTKEFFEATRLGTNEQIVAARALGMRPLSNIFASHFVLGSGTRALDGKL